MKKRIMSKRILSIGIAIIMLFALVALGGCDNGSNLREIDRRIGLNLPRGSNIEFFNSRQDNAWVVRYAIITLSREPANIVNDRRSRSSESLNVEAFESVQNYWNNAHRLADAPEEFIHHWAYDFYCVLLGYCENFQGVRRVIYFPELNRLFFSSVNNT